MPDTLKPSKACICRKRPRRWCMSHYINRYGIDAFAALFFKPKRGVKPCRIK